MPCDRAPGTGDTVSGPFINWAENVTTNPQQIFQPTTLDELVAIVKQAEADNLSVHAVGSGWSFTDVMTATGYMAMPFSLF
jgi:FAD/FMN-containing dehydrogenase